MKSSFPKFTKRVYDETCKKHGVNPSAPIDGNDQIPKTPEGQFFWLCIRLEEPVFDSYGNHTGHKYRHDNQKKFLIGFFAGLQLAQQMHGLPFVEGWADCLRDV